MGKLATSRACRRNSCTEFGRTSPSPQANMRVVFALFLLSCALHAANAAVGDTLTYTTSNTNAMRSGCHTSARCIDHINDGNVQITPAPGDYSDWLTNGVNTGNVASRMWIILDLGAANTKCVGAVGVWGQNEYSSSGRSVSKFNLFASDSTSSFTTQLLTDAPVAAAGNANPNPERKNTVPNCVVARYIKWVATGVHSTDGYAGITELRLYEGAVPDLPNQWPSYGRRRRGVIQRPMQSWCNTKSGMATEFCSTTAALPDCNDQFDHMSDFGCKKP